VAEPSGSPSSSSSPPSERLPKEPFLELPESLEGQGVELVIVLRIQPLSLLPLPTSDTGSLADFGLEFSNNPVQTPESSPPTDSQLGLVIYPPNPLFDLVVISSQCPYSPYDQPGVPFEVSPHTSLVVRCHLFPDIEAEGDALITSPDESKVSTPHIVEEEEHPFPPECFPYTWSIPINVYWELPPNYILGTVGFRYT